MGSREAEKAAAVEVVALDRFTLKQPDPNGLLPGFASFGEAASRGG